VNLMSALISELAIDVNLVRHAMFHNRAVIDFLLLARGHGGEDFEGIMILIVVMVLPCFLQCVQRTIQRQYQQLRALVIENKKGGIVGTYYINKGHDVLESF